MKIKQLYLGIGAFAAILSAAAFTGHSLRDANAQQSTTQTDTEIQSDADQVDRTRQSDQGQSIQRQAQNRTGRQARSGDPNKRSWRASELIGMNVRARTGEDEIGEISDVMIGPEGKIEYAAVSFGGFLGLGEKLFAVPWEAIQFVREGQDEDDIYARIDVSEQQLRSKRGFNNDRWPREADESFLPEGSRSPRQVERPVPSTQNQNVPR